MRRREEKRERERGTAAEWITEPVSAHNSWNTPLPDCPPSSSAAVEADQKGFSNNELALPQRAQADVLFSSSLSSRKGIKK